MNEKEQPMHTCGGGDRKPSRFFSEEDVAHMIAADVRDHYDDIMESMKKW